MYARMLHGAYLLRYGTMCQCQCHLAAKQVMWLTDAVDVSLHRIMYFIPYDCALGRSWDAFFGWSSARSRIAFDTVLRPRWALNCSKQA